MRSLLEGGGLKRGAERFYRDAVRGKHDRNQPGRFLQNFALIAICVISAWHCDQSFG